MARENGRIVVIFAKDNQEAVVLNPILLKFLVISFYFVLLQRCNESRCRYIIIIETILACI
jgi:hypothetical protein